MAQVTLGTATSQPGTLQYGEWAALAQPTGHTEFLPVIIAQGWEEGPCMWLTAGIHGPEHAGPLVIYRLLTQALVEQLKGAIVAIPALNPAGLRTMSRAPYHAATDPNRLWPEAKPEKPQDPDKAPPSSLERAYKRLFGEMVETADYLIDYHNAWTGSISFVFRDRILYRADQAAEENRQAAEKPWRFTWMGWSGLMGIRSSMSILPKNIPRRSCIALPPARPSWWDKSRRSRWS